jgi:hypothetical protein
MVQATEADQHIQLPARTIIPAEIMEVPTILLIPALAEAAIHQVEGAQDIVVVALHIQALVAVGALIPLAVEVVVALIPLVVAHIALAGTDK